MGVILIVAIRQLFIGDSLSVAIAKILEPKDDHLNERDATTLWRRLFDGQKITTSSLAKAKTLLESMNPESPLRMRLATELEDIRQLWQKK